MHHESNMLRRRALLAALAASVVPVGLGGLSACAAVGAEPPWTEPQAYEAALEAYVYNYPLVYFARLRAARMLQADPVSGVASAWGAWSHRSTTVTPAVPGAPQTDTLYSSLWLDVRAEPMVVVVPNLAGRYWSIQFSDLMGSTFGLLNRRNFKDGGPVVVAGPDWTGALPAGLPVLRTQMAQSFNLLRLFFAGPQDLPMAVALQAGFQAVPLSAWQRGERRFAGASGSAVVRPVLPKDDALADFKAVRQMWRDTPPADVPGAMRQRLSRLGLIGGDTSFDTLPPEIRKALERAEAEGRRQVTQVSLALPGNNTRNGWVAPRPSIGTYNDGDRMYRASVTLAGTVALPVTENPYFVMQKEPGGGGALLHGDHRYELRFAKDMIPEVDAFWSLHAYNQTYRVIPNPINRYALGDRSPGLVYGPDGSLTVYLQADDPGEARRANWLPVKRGEAFWLIVRAYEPRGRMRDLSWEGAVVGRVG